MVREASGESKRETSTGGIEVNEEKMQKYYVRLGIKPPSPSADVVRDDEVESVITSGGKDKIQLPPDAAETKQVESVTDHKSTYEETCDAQIIELKEGKGDRDDQAQELRGQTRKTDAEELVKSEAEAVEGDTGREGNLRESAADEAAPDSGQFLGSKAADELEAGRATLAAATILPLGLLGTKKAWLWAVVLVGLAIAGYFFLKWYFRRDENTSLPKEASETSSGDSIRDFMDNY